MGLLLVQLNLALLQSVADFPHAQCMQEHIWALCSSCFVICLDEGEIQLLGGENPLPCCFDLPVDSISGWDFETKWLLIIQGRTHSFSSVVDLKNFIKWQKLFELTFSPDFSNSLQYCILYFSHLFEWRQLLWILSSLHPTPSPIHSLAWILSSCALKCLSQQDASTWLWYRETTTVQIKCSSRKLQCSIIHHCYLKELWKYGQDVLNPSLGQPQDTIVDARSVAWWKGKLNTWGICQRGRKGEWDEMFMIVVHIKIWRRGIGLK